MLVKKSALISKVAKNEALEKKSTYWHKCPQNTLFYRLLGGSNISKRS